MPRVAPGSSPCPPGLAARIPLPFRWSGRNPSSRRTDSAGEGGSAPDHAGSQRREERSGFRAAADSGWWLIGAAALFVLAQLLAVPVHMGLSWDEAVYVSQVSGHAPAAFFDPARARGVPLLVAPVTLLTSSAAALRVCLAFTSGLALLGALWTWRPTRPAWVLALAGLAYGGLWVTLYYGPQAMPDGWVALSGLAAAGFFLRTLASWPLRPALGAPGHVPASPAPGAPVRSSARQPPGVPAHPSRQSAPITRRRWPALTGLTGSLAAAALFRPGDAAYLTAALLLAVLAVRAWRHWLLATCVIAGFAAGAAEWVIEAYLRFGGPLHRLQLAGAEQGGLRPRLAIWDELRALNGPTLCRPCTIGWRYPVLSVWWLALPVLVALGVLAARRAGRDTSAARKASVHPGTPAAQRASAPPGASACQEGAAWQGASSALAAWCALALAAQYLFGIGYAAPRFLLPAYALLAIPVADCLAWLLTGIRPGLRKLTVPAVTVALLAQLAAQQLVLAHEVRGTVLFHRDYQRIVAGLRRLGVRPPCLIKGEQYIPIAYDAGCASAPSPARALTAGQPVAVLAYRWQPRPACARRWRRRRLPGTRILKLVACLPPPRP